MASDGQSLSELSDVRIMDAIFLIQDALSGNFGGVSRPQLRVLRKLAAQALTVSALREALNISSPGVTQMLDKLQALGLVSRSGSAHDQRVVLVELTPAGRNALAAAQAAFLERVRALFAPLSDEEKAQVAQLLMRAATSADPSETAHRASAKGV